MRAITALLVHDEEEPFQELRRRLRELGISWLELRTFVETKYLLKRLRHPALIFTSTTLPDGAWADVIEATKNTTPPCPVIVVSRLVDLDLYLEALQKGAVDFIVAPFRSVDLESVIRSATTQLDGSPSGARAASDCRSATGAGTLGAEDHVTARSDVGRTEARGRALAASAR